MDFFQFSCISSWYGDADKGQTIMFVRLYDRAARHGRMAARCAVSNTIISLQINTNQKKIPRTFLIIVCIKIVFCFYIDLEYILTIFSNRYVKSLS
jgi:hypothetical protein